jgi:hypothetical protein
MAVPVSLASLVSAVQFAAPGAVVCIDTVTGEVIEGTADSRQDSERFQIIALDFDEGEIAKRFCETIADRDDRQRLETALTSAQPLESFEHALYRAGIAHQWFPFRERQLGDLAKAWLETAGIPFVDDLA